MKDQYLIILFEPFPSSCYANVRTPATGYFLVNVHSILAKCRERLIESVVRIFTERLDAVLCGFQVPTYAE